MAKKTIGSVGEEYIYYTVWDSGLAKYVKEKSTDGAYHTKNLTYVPGSSPISVNVFGIINKADLKDEIESDTQIKVLPNKIQKPNLKTLDEPAIHALTQSLDAIKKQDEYGSLSDKFLDDITNKEVSDELIHVVEKISGHEGIKDILSSRRALKNLVIRLDGEKDKVKDVVKMLDGDEREVKDHYRSNNKEAYTTIKDATKNVRSKDDLLSLYEMMILNSNLLTKKQAEDIARGLSRAMDAIGVDFDVYDMPSDILWDVLQPILVELARYVKNDKYEDEKDIMTEHFRITRKINRYKKSKIMAAAHYQTQFNVMLQYVDAVTATKIDIMRTLKRIDDAKNRTEPGIGTEVKGEELEEEVKTIGYYKLKKDAQIKIGEPYTIYPKDWIEVKEFDEKTEDLIKSGLFSAIFDALDELGYQPEAEIMSTISSYSSVRNTVIMASEGVGGMVGKWTFGPLAMMTAYMRGDEDARLKMKEAGTSVEKLMGFFTHSTLGEPHKANPPLDDFENKLRDIFGGRSIDTATERERIRKKKERISDMKKEQRKLRENEAPPAPAASGDGGTTPGTVMNTPDMMLGNNMDKMSLHGPLDKKGKKRKAVIKHDSYNKKRKRK